MSDSPVSRRRFLQGLGLSVAAVSASPLLSACGGGSSGLSGDQGPASSEGGKPTPPW
jgi:multiple sugar transport system substrate-binding protein